MSKHKLRQGVAAVVLDQSNQVLICQRFGDPTHYQFPQGGIKKGEDLKTALLRELHEEIGTNNVTILAELPHKTHYLWPDFLQQTSEYVGQEHRWFVVRLHENEYLLPSIEFSDFSWIPPGDILKRTFYKRHDTYRLVIKMIRETSLELDV